jgi:hypothetical protein
MLLRVSEESVDLRRAIAEHPECRVALQAKDAADRPCRMAMIDGWLRIMRENLAATDVGAFPALLVDQGLLLVSADSVIVFQLGVPAAVLAARLPPVYPPLVEIELR